MLTDWSGAASALWGKTGVEGAWLPLVTHLEDTADVAEVLWDRWLPSIVRRRVAAALGGSDLAARSLYVWVASVHDVAKGAPAFQSKARRPDCEHLIDRLERQGLVTPQVHRDEYAHHGIMGQILLEEWLKTSSGLSREQARSLAVIVGGHHGVPPTSAALVRVRTMRRRRRGSPAFGDLAWDRVRQEILDWSVRRTNMTMVFAELPADGLPVTVQADLSAALIVADWLASDETRFTYDGLKDPAARRQRALATISLPPPWSPEPVALDDPDSALARRFPRLAGRPLRPLQRAVVDVSSTVDGVPLVVIEAPMGAGKTEAALMSAEILAHRFGCGGTFVALPTMATSDAMFGRVLSWLRHLPVGEVTSVYLAHSKAGLNDEFAGLVAESRARFTGVYDDDGELDHLSPLVDSWLRGRKRGVLADHVVGTIDQVLFGALQSKHLALRHLALAGKVVIIDEVHAADDYMRVYLEMVLEWLGAYGTPVVLLSATLPKEQRRTLIAAYLRGRTGSSENATNGSTDAETRYPIITTATSKVTATPVAAEARTTDVDLHLLSGESVRDLLTRELSDGGCAAVIRNTVTRAQEAYTELAREFGSDVVLVHSRFIGPDRMRLEQDLRSKLGPPGEGASRPRRFIVVGTQVLEQSLDIDVDIMISDVAPMDLILQRVGRLHRHERPRGARPERLAQARLYLDAVTTAYGHGRAPTFAAESEGVYGEYRLLRTMHAVQQHVSDPAEPIVLPRDIPLLVERAYDDSVEAPAGWEERWQESKRAYDKERADQRQEAQKFRLRSPSARLDLVDWLTAPVTAESDDVERIGRGHVRDTEDSLEIVLTYRGDDDLLHVMPGAPNADAAIPTVIGRRDEEIARAASTCTVRLPRALTHPGVLDRVIDDLERLPEAAGWQDSRWLRGQLVLPLDAGFRAHLRGFVIHYDRKLGLLVRRDETSGKEA